MSNSLNSYRIGEQQALLITILNSMHNDNIRQIDNMNETINRLHNYNNDIRNYLIQLLNPGSQTRRSTPQRQRDVRQPAMTYMSDLINLLMNEPIAIVPTQSQIENATRHVCYSSIARPINTQCPISMDEFSDDDMVTVIRQCGHTFYDEHLMNWFRTNCRCPVCRYDIREYSNSSNEYFNANVATNAATTNVTTAEQLVNNIRTSNSGETIVADLSSQELLRFLTNYINRN